MKVYKDAKGEVYVALGNGQLRHVRTGTLVRPKNLKRDFTQSTWSDVAHRYAITKDTYWVSRKGRYVRIVQVTDKIVRLRDAITDDYLGFRALSDFARTYQPRLKEGEQWLYGRLRVTVKGIEKGKVDVFDRWVGTGELVLVKEFLARASFVKDSQPTQPFGRAIRPKASPKLTFGREGFLADFKTFSEYYTADVKATEDTRVPFKVAVGQLWKSGTREIFITDVGSSLVGYKTKGGSRGCMYLDTILEQYTLVEVKTISGSWLLVARDYIKRSQFTLEAPGLRSTFANKESFIDFCKAVVKCQQSM